MSNLKKYFFFQKDTYKKSQIRSKTKGTHGNDQRIEAGGRVKFEQFKHAPVY